MAVGIITPQQEESGIDKFLRRLAGVAQIVSTGADIYNIPAKRRALEAEEKIKAQEAEFYPEKFAKEQEAQALDRRYKEAMIGEKERQPQREAEERALKLKEIGMKEDERRMALEVPGVGIARTPEDAKQLKDALETKADFDRQLDELIGLRQKYGAEVLDRTAVSRAKQLSKDLLLKYKNMAKLGVLSKSDEDIINAILPSDPLKWAPMGAGDVDPVLNQLQKFKEDTGAAFTAKVGARIRGGAGLPELIKQKPKAKAVSNVPKPGDVVDGYRFKGGNPADQNSWEQVQ